MKLLSRPEELILLAVWRLQKNAYGATIRNLLTETTDQDWSIAGVYAPLKRLAKTGLIRTVIGPPTPERGGRSKRYYELTQKGVAALNRVKSVHESMWHGFPGLSFAR